MKNYIVKAKNFIEDGTKTPSPTQEGQYVIQNLRTRHRTNEFTIWEDQFGDFESGEAPIECELNELNPFESLLECRIILLDNDCIEEEPEFKDIETNEIYNFN